MGILSGIYKYMTPAIISNNFQDYDIDMYFLGISLY